MSVQMKICFPTSIINFPTAIINLNLHLQQSIKILQRIWTAQEAYVNKITHKGKLREKRTEYSKKIFSSSQYVLTKHLFYIFCLY